MLGFVLLTGDDGRQIDLCLHRLQGVVGEDLPLVIVDKGSRDGTLERVENFVGGAGPGVRLIKLDEPALTPAMAVALARTEIGAEYILGLTGQDLLCPETLEPLTRWLAAQKPDLAIIAQGWWQTGAGAILPPVDLAQMAAGGADPAMLVADPRRLMPSRELAARLEPPGTGPLDEWKAYDAALAAAGAVMVWPDPVLLRPMPESPLQSLFSALTQHIQSLPHAERGAALSTGVRRIGDVMGFCDPSRAEAEIDAALGLFRTLGRGERKLACAVGGPAADLLAALQDGGRRHGRTAARLVLMGQTAVQDRVRIAALTGEIRDLRRDLDLALPGPGYMRELYERLRHS